MATEAQHISQTLCRLDRVGDMSTRVPYLLPSRLAPSGSTSQPPPLAVRCLNLPRAGDIPIFIKIESLELSKLAPILSLFCPTHQTCLP